MECPRQHNLIDVIIIVDEVRFDESDLFSIF